MVTARRRSLRVEPDLAVEFANTAPEGVGAGDSLRSWRDLVDFLELREAITRFEGAALRAMGERDARRSESALAEGLRLRETVRSMLGALAAKRPLKAAWVADVNRALAWGAGAPRLVRQDIGWRMDFDPGLTDPLRALAPIARSIADLAASGRGAEVRRCANPRCFLFFRDSSRARRRRWCSMAVCGNRMKVAAHARRHGRHPTS
jgi:predicted RNA-binding Zn ribbon-like protein